MSCKKDGKQPETISQADQKATEAWFNKSLASNITYMKASDGGVIGMQQQPNWAKAKVLTDVEGSEIIAVPTTIKLAHNMASRGSFILLIKKDDNKLKSRLMFSDVLDKFSEKNITLESVRALASEAFSNNDHSGSVNLSRSLGAKDTNNANGSKPGAVMNYSLPGDCIDWYLVTTEYVDGVAVDSHEKYLYSTCSEEGGSGTHGTINCSYNAEDSANEVTSEVVDVFTKSLSGTTRQQDYHWMILKHRFGMWNFVSHEIGTHKYVDGEWIWDTLVHSSISKNGGLPGLSLKCEPNSIAINKGRYVASIALNFNFDCSAVCEGFPIGFSEDKIAYRNIDVNEGPAVLAY